MPPGATAKPPKREASSGGARVRLHVDPTLFPLIARPRSDISGSDGQARIDPGRHQALLDAAIRALREARKGTSIYLLTFSFNEQRLVLSSRQREAGIEIMVSPAPPGLRVACITEADAASHAAAPPHRAPKRRTPRW
jgi:hypothetical protein